MTQLTMDNGITTTYSYYPAETDNNRLWEIQVWGGSLLDLKYGYDDAGNVVQIADEQAQTQSFAYDANGSGLSLSPRVESRRIPDPARA